MVFNVSFHDDSAFNVSFGGDETLNADFGAVTFVPIGGKLYEGDYIVEPDFAAQVLPTKERLLEDDVTVTAIRVSKTSNDYGTTVYIGRAING